MLNQEIKKRVMSVLKTASFASIADVAREAKTMRPTARKHLEALVRDGDVVEMRKGPCRLFFLRNKII